MEGIPYGITVEDDGMVHSLDKFKIQFCLSISYKTAIYEIKSTLSFLSDWKYQPERNLDGYNGFEDKPPCSAFQFYSSALWCDGCMFRFGQYRRGSKVVNLLSGERKYHWFIDDVVTVEFNPNKCFYTRSDINACLIYLVSVSRPLSSFDLSGRVSMLEYDGLLTGKAIFLLEVDYSVDIPVKTRDIISTSKKDRVIYKDSRYYGKRHQNGRLKVYNKRLEIKDKIGVDIGEELTRCELTSLWGHQIDFSQVSLCLSRNSLVFGLSSNLCSIAKLILLLVDRGEEPEELLENYVPDKRNRDKLRPFVSGIPARYIFDINIFLELLSKYSKYYGFHYSFCDSSSKLFGTPAIICDKTVLWGENSVRNDSSE